MNRSSFFTRHGVGRLFKKCAATQTVQRRLLKAFSLCTLPAMSIGVAYGQANGEEEGVVNLRSLQDDGVVTADAVSDGSPAWAQDPNPYAGYTPSARPFSPEMFPTETASAADSAGGISQVSFDSYRGSTQQAPPNFGEFSPYGPNSQFAAPYQQSIEQTQFQTLPNAGPNPFVSGSADASALGYAIADNPELVRYRLGRNNHEIAGTPRGWTTLGAFVPFANDAGESLFFVNPQFIVDDGGRAGASIGLGLRKYDSVSDYAREFSVWGDFDDGFQDTYSQVGMAMAFISPNWEYRFGANWVVTSDYNNIGGAVLNTSAASIVGSSFVVPTTQLAEAAFDRYDFEVAVPFSFLGPWGGTAGFGGYGLDGPAQCEGGFGVSGRFEVQFNENFWANVVVTNDPVFDTNVSLNFEYTLPDGRSRDWLRKPEVRDFLTSTTRRRSRPTVQLKTQTSISPVLDKAGNPYQFAFIDPNQTAAGTGTLENPFMSLADYAPNAANFQVVVVRPSTSATLPQDTNLNTGIVLQDGQYLTSDAVALQLPGSSGGTAGLFTLAPFRFNNPNSTTTLTAADPVLLPTLSNSGATSTTPVVTLGNNNLVQGFRIDATDALDNAAPAANAGYGIASRAGGITGFDIRHNEFVRFIEAAHIDTVGTGYGVFEDNFVHGRVSNDGNATLADLGFTLADLGLSLTDVSTALGTTFTDETAALAAMTLSPVSLRTVGTSNSLGNGLGRVRGLQVTQLNAGVLSLLVQNNNIEGIGGEDLNSNGVLDPGEDVNASGGLPDVGRAVYVEMLAGTLDAARPDDPIVRDANFCITTGPTGFIGNTIGEFDAAGNPVLGSGATYGIDVVGRPGTVLNVVERNNRAGGGVGAAGRIDPGYRLLADGSIINVPEFSGNLSDGSFQDGAQFVALGGGTINFVNPLFSPTIPTLNPTQEPAFRNNTLTNSGSNGMIVQALGGTVNFDALGFQLPDGTTNSVNTFTNNAGAGIVFDAMDIGANAGVINVGQPIAGNTISGNGAEGMLVRLSNDGAANFTFGQKNADGTLALGQSFTGNGTGTPSAGLSIQTGAIDIQSVVPNSDITLANQFTFLPAPPAAPQTIDGTTPGAAFTTSLFGVTSTGNGGNGVEFIGDDGATITVTEMDGLAFNSNTEAGLEIRMEEASTFTAAAGILNSTFNDNARAGLLLSGDGAPVAGTDSTITLNNIQGNQFNRTAGGAGGYGIEFDTTDVDVTANIIQNQFVGSGTDASGPGIGGTVDGNNVGAGLGGGVTLTIGSGNAADTNLFLNNADAHIGFVLGGTSTNSIRIDNHILRGAVDRSAATTTLPPSFDGDGVAYDLQDQATLAGGIFNSKIIDNSGDGIDITVGGLGQVGAPPVDLFARLNAFEINDNTILGNGDGTFTAAEFGDNGIELTRTSNGILGDLADPLEIQRNIVIANENNGLFVNVQNDAQTDHIDATDNEFNFNGFNVDVIDIPNPNGTDQFNNTTGLPGGDGIPDPFPIAVLAGTTTPIDTVDLGTATASAAGGNGAALVTTGDAILDIDLTTNEFNGNANSGILQTSVRLSGLDAELLTGTWTGNEITLNREDGIELTGNFTGLQIGLAANPRPDNTIAMNQSDGIEITGSGTVSIESNLITQNGLGFTAGTGETGLRDFDEGGDSQMAAIDIDANGITALINNNEITDNRGDAIEYRNNGAAVATLNVTNNIIDFNDGRGVDLLAAATSPVANTFTFNIDNNDINNNRLQGVYVVTTSSVSQAQNIAAGTLLDRTGAVNLDYDVNFTLNNNRMFSNGIDVNGTGGADLGGTGVQGNADNTTGFVLRVGSTDGGNGITDPGGFAATRGGVIGTVTNNAFGGNFGNDLLIEGFASTGDPNSGTTWNNTDFNANGYQSDPLARLDLIFGTAVAGTDNTFVSGLFTQTGAVYTNTDANFKSRVDNPANNDEDGPFSTGARRRNAQRLAVRTYPDGTSFGPGAFPGFAGSSDGGVFLYPGLGDSTFRINRAAVGGDAGITELIGEGFIFDTSPLAADLLPHVDNFGDLNGIINNGPGGRAVDDPIYGWGVFP